jgi:hypothetical protein
VHGVAPLYESTEVGGVGAEASSRPDPVTPGLSTEFPPKRMSPAEEPATLQYPGSERVPADPIQTLILTDRPTAAPLALDRTDPKAAPLVKRVGMVEAVLTGSGQVAWAKELSVEAGGLVAEGEWQPLELVGTVSSTGLIGGLVVRRSSGSTKVDSYFSDRLVRGEQVGERLPLGTYLFRIAP